MSEIALCAGVLLDPLPLPSLLAAVCSSCAQLLEVVHRPVLHLRAREDDQSVQVPLRGGEELCHNRGCLAIQGNFRSRAGDPKDHLAHVYPSSCFFLSLLESGRLSGDKEAAKLLVQARRLCVPQYSKATSYILHIRKPTIGIMELKGTRCVQSI